jgi:hypothetical protein
MHFSRVSSLWGALAHNVEVNGGVREQKVGLVYQKGGVVFGCRS